MNFIVFYTKIISLSLCTPSGGKNLFRGGSFRSISDGVNARLRRKGGKLLNEKITIMIFLPFHQLYGSSSRNVGEREEGKRNLSRWKISLGKLCDTPKRRRRWLWQLLEGLIDKKCGAVKRGENFMKCEEKPQSFFASLTRGIFFWKSGHFRLKAPLRV